MVVEPLFFQSCLVRPRGALRRVSRLMFSIKNAGLGARSEFQNFPFTPPGY